MFSQSFVKTKAMITEYAKQLLAKSEVRAAGRRFQEQPRVSFQDSSVKSVDMFRVWETGFNAHEQGIPLEVIKGSHARQGWLAAAKVDELAKSDEAL